MRKVKAVLNPDKDMSVAHAFDPNRVAPRPIYDPPWGEHPDDDMFIEEHDPTCTCTSCVPPWDVDVGESP